LDELVLVLTKVNADKAIEGASLEQRLRMMTLITPQEVSPKREGRGGLKQTINVENNFFTQ
jgi:nicotinic acid mononucleotide adenylyltransferase